MHPNSAHVARRTLLAALLAILLTAVGSAAWAYWTTTGAGAGSATTGTLGAPINPTASTTNGLSNVTVSWTAPVGSPTPTGYYVTRIGSSAAPACGTSPAAPTTTTSCTDTSVPDGTYRYTVTAVYGSWSATSAQSNAVTVTGAVTTTTTISSSSNPSVVGQTVTYTATVTAGSSGTVTFKDGTTTITACSNQPLSAGSVSCAISYASTGSHSITATYNGDSGHLASTSTALSQIVNQAATSTALVAAPSTTVTGQSTTLTATVAITAPGSGTPTGSVTFSNGSTVLCSSVALNATGHATCATTLPIGINTLTAVYGGSTNFSASTGSVSQTTNAANTTTVLSTSAGNVVPGVTATFTATVAALAPGAGVPSGTVAFKDNGSSILCSGGSQTVNASGSATCQISYPVVGTHTVTAVFTPAGTDYLASTSPAMSQKVSAATGIVFTSLTTSAGALTTCGGAGSATYSCTSSGSNAPNNSTYSTQVSYVDSTGAPVAVSNAAQSLSVAYTGKFTGSPTITIPAGVSTSTATLSVAMVGNNGGSMTVSAAPVGGVTWKAILTVN